MPKSRAAPFTGCDGTKTAAANVNLTVSPPTISPASQNLSGQTGQAVAPTTVFTPAGLTTSITYSVSPDLPAGLRLNTTTGVISGTPSEEQASLTYTITASDGTRSAASTVNIAIAAGGGSGGGGGGGNSGLPDTGTSLRIVGITLGSALMLYIAGIFIFRGRRQLGFAADETAAANNEKRKGSRGSCLGTLFNAALSGVFSFG